MKRYLISILALWASAAAALAQTSALTINTTSGQVNVPAGSATPNFTALKLGGVSITLPSGSLVGTSATQTLTNKTLTAPIIDSSITLGDGVTIPFSKLADAPIVVGTGGVITMGTGNLIGPDAGGTILTTTDISVTVQPYSASTTTLGNTTSGSGSTILRQSSPTITTPRFADLGYLADSNGNELIILDSNTNAVNEITVANAATGNKPTISATGGDTNISLNLVPKGSGTVQAAGVDVVTTTGTQTLTNKTISGSSNTITNVSLTSGVTGTLPIANGGSGFADPLLAHIRVIGALGLSETATNGGYNTNNAFTTQWLSNASLASGDKHQLATAAIGGIGTGSSVAYFSTPIAVTWSGYMQQLPANANYGLFVGDGGSSSTVANAGFGWRVIDDNTLQLVLRVSGTDYTQNATVTGFLAGGANPNRQHILITWDGVSTLRLYAGFVTYTGGAVPTPTLRATVTQAASGAMNTSQLRYGAWATGASTPSTQVLISTTSLIVREGL